MNRFKYYADSDLKRHNIKSLIHQSLTQFSQSFDASYWYKRESTMIQLVAFNESANRSHIDCQIGIAIPRVAAIRNHRWCSTPSIDDCQISGFTWYLNDCIQSPALWSLQSISDSPVQFANCLKELNANLCQLQSLEDIYQSEWFTLIPTSINRMLCHYLMGNSALGEAEKQRLASKRQSQYLPEPVRNWLQSKKTYPKENHER